MLHSLVATSDVPDDVWNKIEEFQKSGTSANFAQSIAGAESLKQVNMDVIAACQQTLEAEETEDTALRTQYGERFNRPPSATVNAQYKTSLFDYKGKVEMAVATDTQIKTKYDSN